MGLGRIVAGVMTLGGSEVVRHVFKKRADGTEVEETEQENTVADEISMIPLTDAAKPAATATPTPTQLIDPAEFTTAIDGVIAERDLALKSAVAAKAERDEAIAAKAAAVKDRDDAITAKAAAEAKVAGLEQRAATAEARAANVEKERDAARNEAQRVTGEFQKLEAIRAKLKLVAKPKA